MPGVWNRLARSRPRRGDGGYSVVEAAISLPVLILFTMLVVQWALLWHGRHVVEAAVQDGVRAARGYQATATDGQQSAEAYLQAVAPNLLTSQQVQVTRTATTVTVHIHATVIGVLPAGGLLDITESGTGPVEAFT